MIAKFRFRLSCILAGALLAMPPAPGQDRPSDQTSRARPGENSDKPLIGIYLTPRTLDYLLDKAARRLAKDYDFDEYQQEQIRQLLHERVPAFLNEHHSDLQRLVDDFLKCQASDTPPDVDFAADWAGRALPIFDEFKGMVSGMAEDMREVMTDEQQVVLDGYMAVFDTGANFTTRRLHVFKEGGFDPEIDWPRSKRFREVDPVRMRELHEEMQTARQVAMSGSAPARPQPGAEIAAPGDAKLIADARVARKTEKDEWTRYVEQFIRRYRLNDEQKQRAYQLLSQRLTERDCYLRQKADDMKRIEDMFVKAKTPEKLALAESAFKNFNRPLENMFERLKQKLDRLPTREQRRVAARSDQQSDKPGKAALPGQTDKRQP